MSIAGWFIPGKDRISLCPLGVKETEMETIKEGKVYGCQK